MAGETDVLKALRALPRDAQRRLAQQLDLELGLDRPELEARDGVWFLTSLDRVNCAIQVASDLESLASNVLEACLQLFGCGRAWLASSSSASADSWRVAMERTQGAFTPALGGAGSPLDDVTLVAVLRAVLATSGATEFGPGAQPVPEPIAARFGVHAQLVVALFPKGTEPYVLGLQRCDDRGPWRSQDARLLEEIGRRLADALTSMMALRSLRDSERRLDDAQRIAHVGYWDRDLSTGMVTLSEESARIFGFPPTDRLFDLASWHDRWVALLDPQDRARVTEAFATALAGGPRYEVEYRIVRDQGEVRTIHSRGEVLWAADGQPSRMFGVMQDITELRQAELAARASEARFRAIVEHAADAFLLLDAHLRIVDVNRQACDGLGYSRVELVGKHVGEVEAVAGAFEQLAARAWAGESLTLETDHRRRDGSTFPVEIHCARLDSGSRHLLALVRDITARKQAERALIESHGLLQAVVEGTSDPIFIKDLQGRYLMINSAGAAALGRSADQMLGKADRELFALEEAARASDRDQEVIATEQARAFQETRRIGDQVRHYLTTKAAYRDLAGQVVGLFGISRDVTDMVLLEDQLRQAQKLEAIGQLAGGVAHDFNNLLTVVTGCTELALLETADAGVAPLLTEIRDAAGRAAALTRQLLAFSRQQVLDAQVVDLNQVLTRVASLLKRLIGADVELSLRLAPALGPVKVDPAQFEQAIVNLAVNARDALPEGGWLTLETSNVEIGATLAAPHPELPAGSYVLVTVSDSGQGMEPSTIARIFEPFFTTKSVGKGTGLGLAMVYGFIKQSGGHIEVQSEVGQGTAFRLYLPLAKEPLTVAAPRPAPAQHPSGHETILLVEDEDAVRRVCGRVLVSRGYRVLEARDGEEALQLVERHQGELHLLVSDLVMPRLGGRELAAKLRAALPALRVLFLSGYTEEELEHGEAFLPKPFTVAALACKVREVLDGATGPGRTTPVTSG